MAVFKSHLIAHEALFQLLGTLFIENLKSYKKGKIVKNPKHLINFPANKAASKKEHVTLKNLEQRPITDEQHTSGLNSPPVQS